MICQWKAYLLERADEWNVPATGKWNALVYNNYHPHCRDIDVLWFHDEDRFPRLVMKASNRPGPAEREFANLVRVYPVASKWVPKPLRFAIQEGSSMLWMEGLPGMQFQGRCSPRVLRSVAEMLSSIHKAVSTGVAKTKENRWDRSVMEPLETVAGFGSSAAVREGCRQLMERTSSGWIDLLPSIPQHGDLYMGNVLSHIDSWYIVDWESFGLIDLPAYDLYTLLLSLLRTDGDTSAQWSRSLVEEVPKLVAWYGGELGLTSADLKVLLPLTLANWFYIQWCDGRKEFSERLYRNIQDYFENLAVWEEVFFSK